MATKSIAVKDDVSTKVAPGSKPFSGFDPGGTWKAVSFEVETRAHMTVGGAATAWKAKASFVYTGSISGAAPSPSGPSDVSLSGSSSGLKVAGAPLLRDGDSAEDSYGNKISVSASGPLKSD